jgi:hypothetical protein
MRRFLNTLCFVTALFSAGSTGATQPLAMGVEWVKSPRPVLQDSAVSAPVSLEDDPNAAKLQWAIQLEDKTLSQTLTRWTQQAQWQLVWEAERDFPIEAQVTMEGGFHAAISMVMQSLADSDYPLQASMNPQTRVLRIVRYMQPRLK